MKHAIPLLLTLFFPDITANGSLDILRVAQECPRGDVRLIVAPIGRRFRMHCVTEPQTFSPNLLKAVENKKL